jgi:hypothetical protein
VQGVHSEDGKDAVAAVRLVIVNRDATAYDHLASAVPRSPIDAVLPRLAAPLAA